MGYKRSRPRTYALTPSRKRIGKALARKAPRTVAVQALAGPTTRLHLLSEIGRILRAEMTAMCSDKTASLLRTHSIQDLSHFQWKNVIQELEKSAPVFLHFFTAMHSNKDTKTELWRRNWCVRSNHSQKSFCKNEFVTEDCVSASLRWALWKKSKWFAWTLAKYYLNFLQVYERLQTLNLTMSISSTRRLVKTLGTGYDQKVKDWRDLLATTLSVSNKIKQ